MKPLREHIHTTYQFRLCPFCYSGKSKRLVVGSIPTQNLPVKSISPSPLTTRRELVRPELAVNVPVVY